jgi:hypothetical protein
MPITPAHAAAAWPLRTWLPRLPLSALIIGTMSPDCEYFLTLAPITRVAHTLPGIALFCVPVSLAVWFVFRHLVRPAIVDLLPPGAARAIGPASASWGLALAAVVLGAVSHVIWDGFTHHNDWGVNLLPILRTQPIPPIVPLPWYKLLQYGRSVGGVLVLALWTGGWLRSLPAAALEFAPGQLRRAAFVVAWVLLVSVLGALADGWWGRRSSWPVDLGRAAIGAMAAGALAVLVFATISAVRRRAAVSP